MSDDKSRFLKNWVSDLQDSVSSLREAAAASVSKHSKCAIKTQQLATTLRRMEVRENSQNAKAVYDDIVKAVEELEGKHRQIVVQRLQRHFLGKAEEYEKKAKTQEENVKQRNKLLKNVEEGLATLKKLNEKSKKQPSKINDQRNKLRDSRERLRLAEDNLSRSLERFERARVEDMREMLMRYAENHMYIYARGLEVYTRVYNAAAQLDSEAAAAAMAQELAKYGNLYGSPQDGQQQQSPQQQQQQQQQQPRYYN